MAKAKRDLVGDFLAKMEDPAYRDVLASQPGGDAMLAAFGTQRALDAQQKATGVASDFGGADEQMRAALSAAPRAPLADSALLHFDPNKGDYVQRTDAGEQRYSPEDAVAATRRGLDFADLGLDVRQPSPKVQMGAPQLVARTPMPPQGNASPFQVGLSAQVKPMGAFESLIPSMPRDPQALASGPGPASPPSGAGPTGNSRMRALLDAQGASADSQLIAGLTRAGAMGAQALTLGRGAKVNAPIDQEGLKALDANSDRPVQAFAQQEQYRTQFDKDDPNSPESKAVQQYIEKTFPGLYSKAELSQIPAKDAALALEPAKMRAQLQAKQTELASSQAFQRGELERQLGAHASEAAKQRGFEGQQKALDRAAELERTRVGTGAVRLQSEVQNAGKDLEDFGRMADDVNLLSKWANSPKGTDIPGVGKIDSRLPDFMSSDDALQVRQAATNILNKLVKEQTGAVATPAEIQRVAFSYGIGPGSNEESFRLGVARLARDAENAMKRREAKYDPTALSVLRGRGGASSAGFQNAQKQVVETRQAPDGRTLVKYSDGSIEAR